MAQPFFYEQVNPIASEGIKPFNNPLKKSAFVKHIDFGGYHPLFGASVWYAINAERRWMTLSKGRLGTINEGVILFLSECDLDVERWMTVELSLHHVAGQTGTKSGQ